MEWLKILFSAIKEFFPFIFMYNAGRKSKELDDTKADNEKLKDYQEIDAKDIPKKEIYSSKEWV